MILITHRVRTKLVTVKQVVKVRRLLPYTLPLPRRFGGAIHPHLQLERSKKILRNCPQNAETRLPPLLPPVENLIWATQSNGASVQFRTPLETEIFRHLGGHVGRDKPCPRLFILKANEISSKPSSTKSTSASPAGRVHCSGKCHVVPSRS